jgi:hypothetical protein
MKLFHLYSLDYIDSVQLRRNVQRALNRGESYHKLHRAFSYANFGKLRFKSEQEQHIWEECGRLLANCIIYYNASRGVHFKCFCCRGYFWHIYLPYVKFIYPYQAIRN